MICSGVQVGGAGAVSDELPPGTKAQGGLPCYTGTLQTSAGIVSANTPLAEAYYKLKPLEWGITVYAA